MDFEYNIYMTITTAWLILIISGISLVIFPDTFLFPTAPTKNQKQVTCVKISDPW